MADYNPIWKQYGVDLGSNESVKVLVQEGGTVTSLFEGTAWKKPDESDITFYVNDIARTLFADDVPDLSMALGNQTELTRSYIDVTADGVPKVQDVCFIRDYSYEDHNRKVLSDIVGSGIVYPWNCPLVATFMPGTYEVTKNYLNGHMNTKLYKFTYPTTLAFQRIGATVESIVINGEVMKVTQCGCDYALMWRNRYGGYECMPMFGVKKQTDTLTRNTFNRLFTQTSQYMEERAEVPYLNEIKETLTMNTGIVLNDVQAKMVADLLASPAVWLFENLPISKNEPRAINITNSSAEHLTYKNNGYQPMRFSITAEIAQPRERR